MNTIAATDNEVCYIKRFQDDSRIKRDKLLLLHHSQTSSSQSSEHMSSWMKIIVIQFKTMCKSPQKYTDLSLDKHETTCKWKDILISHNVKNTEQKNNLNGYLWIKDVLEGHIFFITCFKSYGHVVYCCDWNCPSDWSLVC